MRTSSWGWRARSFNASRSRSQQYNSALDRFADFPINIALLNRFTSVKEQNVIFKNLKEGKIDILFGTHKLLNDKVDFKDLGLLIIDEEQRFGVVHKEKVKKFLSAFKEFEENIIKK